MFFAAKSPHLAFDDDGRRRRVDLRTPRFVIGSAETVDLRVIAPGVAPEHVVVERRGAEHVLVVLGLNPVRVAGDIVVRDRTLRHRDEIDLAGVLTLTYVDPAVEAAERRARGPAPKADAAADAATRDFWIKTVVIGLSVVSLVVVLATSGRTPTGPDWSRLTPETIEAALAELPVCLDRAAIAAKSLPPADGDHFSAYGRLARTSPRDGVALAEFTERLRRHLVVALRAEARRDHAEARAALRTVRALVPDLHCAPDRLAAARLAALPDDR